MDQISPLYAHALPQTVAYSISRKRVAIVTDFLIPQAEEQRLSLAAIDTHPQLPSGNISTRACCFGYPISFVQPVEELGREVRKDERAS